MDLKDMPRKKTGTSCYMYVEDTGTEVRLYFKCDDPDWFKEDIWYWYKKEGSSSAWRKFTYHSKGNLQLVTWIYIDNETTLEWHLYQTNDPISGGPTVMKVPIVRSKADPNPPKILYAYPTTDKTEAVVWIAWAGNPGMLRDEYAFELWWSTDPNVIKNGGTMYVQTDGVGHWLSKLKPRQRYYIYARAWGFEWVEEGSEDKKKWVKKYKASKWSSVYGIYTGGYGSVMWNNERRTGIAYVKHDGVWKQAIPYAKVKGKWEELY